MREVKWVDKSLRLNDGVELVSRIWTPKDKGSWPALLMRQPYGREIASTITYSHPEWWASKGYIVVVQDVRGQGALEGYSKGFLKNLVIHQKRTNGLDLSLIHI